MTTCLCVCVCVCVCVCHLQVDETLGAIDLAHRAVVKLGRWWCENINDTWDGRAMLKQIQQ